MTDVVKDVKVNVGVDTEESYTQHFETRKWIGILMALSCIIPSNAEIIPDQNYNRIVCRGLHLVLNLYFELCRDDFSSSNLRKLERDIIPNSLSAAYRIFLARQQLKQSQKHFRGVKLHILLHFPQLIREYGSPKVWDTDTFESAHKEKVKLMYKMGSKRISNVEQEILIRVHKLMFH